MSNKNISAFTYCIRILTASLLIQVILLGGTIYVLTTYGFSEGSIQANMGMLILLLVNIQLICPYFLVRKLVKPLKKINEVSEEMVKGNFKVEIDYNEHITEIDNTFHNFNSMLKELSSIETLRNDFVSNVSHEFKTPLTSIEGYATLLQNTDLVEKEKNEYIEKVLHSTRKLSLLVGNILLLSKLENQHIVPDTNTYRLDEQILQILLSQEMVWRRKNINFDLDLQEISYKGPEHFLYHVWSNLINNAVKYSYENSNIQVSLKILDNNILFKITDHGIGIAEKNLKHIFEKFYQADISREQGGSGLGLAQVEKILDLISGTIHVESTEGKGSTFTIVLHV